MSPTRRLFAGPHDQRIRRALCIAAHPDDVEFFCGGTVLLMAARGAEVGLVVATSGDKGTHDPKLSGRELATMREHEQREAAVALGIAEVTFLRYPDAELQESLELRAEFVREIRRARPDLLLTFDPLPGYRQHPDHRTTGRVALDAAWPCARDRLSFPTPDLDPHETQEAWCFASPSPDLDVDVSPVLEQKISARLLHLSQTSNERALRARWKRVGARERFHRVNLR